MRTLYRNSKLIALVILGTMLMIAGTAVAFSNEQHEPQAFVNRVPNPELIGRFVVTPTKFTFVAATENTKKY